MHSILDAMRKVCARIGNAGMGVLIRAGEVMKGSLEEVMKV